MGRTKNAVLAVAVTGLLLASLFFLFPSTVQAARVTGLAAGGINAATNGDFTVTATITVPEGEHIPVDPSALEVWTRPASESQDADLTDGDGTQCSGATLVRIDTDLDLVHSDFTGYGYGVDDIIDGDNAFGYGYSYGYSYKFAGSTGYELDGAGYGYGYGSTGGEVRVTIRATGCSGVSLGSEPFKPYEVQALVGQFASLPLTVYFVNPTATGTATVVADASGFSIAGGSLGRGTVLTIPMDIVLDGTTRIVQASVEVLSGNALPPGTKFRMLPGTPDIANPAFGVSAATATAQFGGRAMAFHFQFQPEDVNGNVLDLDGRIRVIVTVDVPDSYFTGIANVNKGTFLVRAFDGAGSLKADQPATNLDTDVCSSGCDPWRYDITITHFSSYAGAAAVNTGGGGGSGGGPDTDTTTTTTTTTDGPGDGTDTGGPGDGTDTGGPGDGTGTGGPGDGTGTGGPGDGPGGGPNWGLIIVAIIAIAAVIGAAIFFVMRGKP